MAELSQTAAAKRGRERRARQSAEKKRATSPDGLYDPDAGAADDAPADRREPGRPAGPRSLTRSQSIGALLGVVNLPFRRLFPQDALTAPEVRALADGLVKDPWTGPYVEHLVGIGKHTDLVEAVGMIVMSRLIIHGLLPVEALMSIMPEAFAPVGGETSGSTPAEPPAWDAPDAAPFVVPTEPAVPGEPDFLR